MSRIIRWIIAAVMMSLFTEAFGGTPVRVVTTIFPLTDWTRAVGGERVTVTPLLPPGVEAHTYAPRPRDVQAVSQADVFIYLGPDMEPWALKIAAASERPNRVVLEAAAKIPRDAEAHAHGDHDDPDADGNPADHDGDHDDHAPHRDEEGHPHDTGGTDPHVWLDPVLAQRIVLAIAEALGRADPEGTDMYRRNAETYNRKLQELHERIVNTLRGAKRREILYGGHFAFGYFARRYGLTHRSPYPGFAPNAAPTPRAVAEMIRRLRETGQNIIFHEEMVDPKVARVIAEETGARLVMLHGAHNLTPDEARRGDVTYLSIMEDNMKKLAEALEAEWTPLKPSP